MSYRSDYRLVRDYADVVGERMDRYEENSHTAKTLANAGNRGPVTKPQKEEREER